jgi:hypothetical protein
MITIIVYTQLITQCQNEITHWCIRVGLPYAIRKNVIPTVKKRFESKENNIILKKKKIKWIALYYRKL